MPFGPDEMAGVSTETYCMLSYDSNKKYWKWEAELPQKLRENVVTEISDEKMKYSGVINRIVYWFGPDGAIWYSPGYPVGMLSHLPDSIVSCPFDEVHEMDFNKYIIRSRIHD